MLVLLIRVLRLNRMTFIFPVFIYRYMASKIYLQTININHHWLVRRSFWAPFIFAHSAIFIVEGPFSAHFCTVFVTRLLLSDFWSERSWTHWYVMVRCGTRWNIFGEFKGYIKWAVELKFRKDVNGAVIYSPLIRQQPSIVLIVAQTSLIKIR